MARNPESVLTDAIKKAIKKYAEKTNSDCVILKIGGSAFIRGGIPDLLILWNQTGDRVIPIFMEVKVGKAEASQLQLVTMGSLREVGAVADIVRSPQEAIDAIREAVKYAVE